MDAGGSRRAAGRQDPLPELLLMAFWHHARADAATGLTAPFRGELATVLGVSEDKVNDLRRALIALGFLTVEVAGRGRGKADIYRLTLPQDSPFLAPLLLAPALGLRATQPPFVCPTL